MSNIEGEDFSDGINASAASVAVMLSLAELLPANYFDFDVEFVFFGAGSFCFLPYIFLLEKTCVLSA